MTTLSCFSPHINCGPPYKCASLIINIWKPFVSQIKSCGEAYKDETIWKQREYFYSSACVSLSWRPLYVIETESELCSGPVLCHKMWSHHHHHHQNSGLDHFIEDLFWKTQCQVSNERTRSVLMGWWPLWFEPDLFHGMEKSINKTFWDPRYNITN